MIEIITPEYFYRYSVVDPGEKLKKLIGRATSDIIRITKGRALDIESIDENIQMAVRQAVVTQVEFLHLNGDTASSVTNVGESVRIGNYSESVRAEQNIKATPYGYSQATIEWLRMAGMLGGPIGNRVPNWHGDIDV